LQRHDRADDGRPSLLAVCRDDAPVAAVRAALHGEDISVTGHTRVVRAVARFAAQPSDAVVIDLDALSDSEMECLALFREINPSVWILALHSPAGRRRAAEALDRGVAACLSYPFYAAELRALVRGGRSAQRSGSAEESAAGADMGALTRLAKAAGTEISRSVAMLLGTMEIANPAGKRGPPPTEGNAKVRRRIERIGELASHLLAFGEMTRVPRRRVDVDRVISELADEMSGAVSARLEADLRADGATMTGDEDLLRRAVRMLVQEAATAAPEGVIRVESQVEREGDLEVAVRSESDARGSRRSRSAAPDRGRGDLTTCLVEGMARSQGGSLRVEADAAGRAAFVMRFPASERRTEVAVTGT